MPLSEAEVARYARQLLLPGFGAATQEVLRGARVHVVGAGEMAGPALLYLASAGVGTLFLDDALDIGAGDAAAWIYPPDRIGEPRLIAAMAALRAASSLSKPRAIATGAAPTAMLVCATALGEAREAAEKARQSGLPHVVALLEGDGGQVVTVPRGAPCFACGSRPGTGVPPRPGAAAAVGALAAMELILLLAGAAYDVSGRRIDLVVGHTVSRPTTRVPGCPCTEGWGR